MKPRLHTGPRPGTHTEATHEFPPERQVIARCDRSEAAALYKRHLLGRPAWLIRFELECAKCHIVSRGTLDRRGVLLAQDSGHVVARLQGLCLKCSEVPGRLLP